jgi:hypothetical protein
MDYEKCVNWEGPMRSSTTAMLSRQDTYLEKRHKESQRMAEIMGEELGDFETTDIRDTTCKEEAYRERIRKDLGPENVSGAD